MLFVYYFIKKNYLFKTTESIISFYLIFFNLIILNKLRFYTASLVHYYHLIISRILGTKCVILSKFNSYNQLCYTFEFDWSIKEITKSTCFYKIDA